MKILRITVCVDAFGLACGGGWEWREDNGRRISIVVPPYGTLENRQAYDVAWELAYHAMAQADHQLSLF